MNGNMTFTRVPKKTFDHSDAMTILNHISNRSVEMSGERIPPYAMGALMSTLTRLADTSPAARKELLRDVNWIQNL